MNNNIALPKRLPMQRIDIAMLSRKFNLKLTRGQFEALHQLVHIYLVDKPGQELEERAFYYEVYLLFNKLNARIMGLSAMVQLSVNISQANTLITVLGTLADKLPQSCTYEHSLITTITARLYQQTV